MKISILTLFPHMFEGFLSESIIKRAIEKDLVSFEIVNIRDFAKNIHNQVDDTPYGGGAGMVMMIEPVVEAINSVRTDDSKVILLSPSGKVFNQSMAVSLKENKHLIFICGHYEGIDERVLEEIVTDYISIGDYVLTGGELPAMVLIDAIARLVPGVLSNHESAQTESHSNGLLEYPQYSRPELWHEKRVPEVLLSGHHANIEKWRAEQSIKRTKERRPDLFEAYEKANK